MTISRRDFAGMSAAAISATTLVSLSAAATPTEEQKTSTTGAADDVPKERDGILVPEHFVPTPRTISPQAQAFLRFKPPVEAARMPARDDKKAWDQYREAGNRGIAMLTKPYEKRFPADVVHHQLSHFKVYEVIPKNMAPENAKRAIVYIHGGGFIVGGGEGAIYPAMQMAGMSKMRVYSVDYRLVPDVSFPVPVDDTVEAYRFILGKHKPQHVALFGPSAGANLAAASILKARDQGLPIPAACAMHSCPSDNGDAGDSAYTNFEVDIVLRRHTAEITNVYAEGHDTKDPHLSPVYGDFKKGFPPSILTSGTRDILLSSTVRMHRALLAGGIKAELHVWEAMTHAPFFNAPEEDELYAEHIKFMTAHMAS